MTGNATDVNRALLERAAEARNEARNEATVDFDGDNDVAASSSRNRAMRPPL